MEGPPKSCKSTGERGSGPWRPTQPPAHAKGHQGPECRLAGLSCLSQASQGLHATRTAEEPSPTGRHRLLHVPVPWSSHHQGQGRAAQEQGLPVTSSSHRGPGTGTQLASTDPCRRATLEKASFRFLECEPPKPQETPEVQRCAAPKTPAWQRCEPGPRAPGGLLTSPSPSFSLSLSGCPAASLAGLPSGAPLTLWSR